MPIERGRPGAGLLAHVLVSKYADHLPLYRQSGIYARQGVDLARSTLADWVGRSAALLDPLVDALERHVMGGATLHADDTPVPVLAPGAGRTRTGRLWTYVRDERGAGGDVPPAVLFRYAPDRKGERPAGHLRAFQGDLHADGYAGFDRLYGERIREVACWAHVRRKFFDVHAATGSTTAREALDHIAGLYAVEQDVRGRSPDERRHARQARAGPLLDAFRQWLDVTGPKLSRRSDLAVAIRYALTRWTALTPLPRSIPETTTISSGAMREADMATSSRIESALIASTSRASELIQRREVRCPCCSSIVATLPPPWSIEPCWRCSRPLTLVRMVRYPGLYQLRNVIDLIGSGYGIVTMLLVLSFVLSEMQPRTFAKAVTILLFVIGSLLLVDGALSVRTAIDRTWKVTRYGPRARMLGGAKIAAGGLATGLVVIGLHL